MADVRCHIPLTEVQTRKIGAMIAQDWQHIADDHETGAAILTRPVGARWLDAHVAANGSVTYSHPNL